MSNKIKINRGQRRWNKYGKYLTISLIVAGVAVASFLTFKFVKKDGIFNKKEVVAVKEEKKEEVAPPKVEVPKEEVKEEKNNLKIVGKPVVERFTSKDFYNNAVFFGDIFVNALDDFGYIDNHYLYTASFFPASRAINYANEVKTMNPSKVIVMLGMDDANTNQNPNPTKIITSVVNVVKALKKDMPNTPIYVLSETPITKNYEMSGEPFFTQAVIDEVNKGVEKQVVEVGATFINISDALKQNGYLNPQYTTDGYHINTEYYPFILNGIANAVKK